MQRVKTTQDLELKERLVAVNRVTKVTKGGRTFTFAAIVVWVKPVRLLLLCRKLPRLLRKT